MMRPGIILLKEGSDDSQGINQILSNISACQCVVDAVKSTLGPRGMDKIIVDKSKTTITNDGATIINTLEIIHPAAQILSNIACAQDKEIGDGTTSVILLAGQLLHQSRQFLENNISPIKIAHGYLKASKKAINLIKSVEIKIDNKDKSILRNIAKTALNSKLVSVYNDQFSDIIVDALIYIDNSNIKNVIIKKIPGGNLCDTKFVRGIVFKKTFSYAGFEMQPKFYQNVKIACLNVELELKAEKQNAEIRINNVEEYQKIVDAEWKILYDKLEVIKNSGACVVLSKLVIGDVATQWFSDRGIFCAGRVKDEDLESITMSCGGSVRTSLADLGDYLGECQSFEEKQIGDDRFNVFLGGKKSGACSIVIRGAGESFLDEIDRSIHDSLMVTHKSMKFGAIVGGGGAIEMYLSRNLKSYAMTLENKEQIIVSAFARSLEIIPRQLCMNAGIDSAYILNRLRNEHSKDNIWMGVDLENDSIRNSYDACVWEPAQIKVNEILSATEAACAILTADETIKNAKRDASIGGPQ